MVSLPYLISSKQDMDFFENLLPCSVLEKGGRSMNLTICFRLVPRTPSIINFFTLELFTISLSPSSFTYSFTHSFLLSFSHSRTRANSSVTYSLPS